jgi:hypothetical protein
MENQHTKFNIYILSIVNQKQILISKIPEINSIFAKIVDSQS